MIGASAAATGLQIRTRAVTPINRPLNDEIPDRVGHWIAADTADVVRPAEAGKKNRYDQEISRVYLSDGSAGIMLLIAYGTTQSDTLQVHRPEFCYPAAGFAIRDVQSIGVPITAATSVPATFFTASRGERIEQVLYWVRLGDSFPNSWLQQHIARLTDSVRGIIPDGILVRASMLDGNPVQSRDLLSSFLGQLSVGSTPVGRLALLGRS